MLLERSEVQVKAGSEEAFAEAMAERGLPLLTSVEGVRWAKIGRGVENPTKFIFLVEWDALESHAAFSKSAARAEFVKLFAPHVETGSMEHFQMR